MPHNLTPEELRKAAQMVEDAAWSHYPLKTLKMYDRAWREFQNAKPHGMTVPVWCRAEADRIEKESKEKDNG